VLARSLGWARCGPKVCATWNTVGCVWAAGWRVRNGARETREGGESGAPWIGWGRGVRGRRAVNCGRCSLRSDDLGPALTRPLRRFPMVRGTPDGVWPAGLGLAQDFPRCGSFNPWFRGAGFDGVSGTGWSVLSPRSFVRVSRFSLALNTGVSSSCDQGLHSVSVKVSGSVGCYRGGRVPPSDLCFEFSVELAGRYAGCLGLLLCRLAAFQNQSTPDRVACLQCGAESNGIPSLGFRQVARTAFHAAAQLRILRASFWRIH
jgi:hypothetical protein